MKLRWKGFAPVVALSSVSLWSCQQSSTETKEVPSAFLDGVVDLQPHENGACALRSDGTVWCWGQTALKLESSENLLATPVRRIDSATQLSINGESACVVTKTNSVRCWGKNLYGQLGGPPRAFTDPPVDPIELSLTNVKQISLGKDFGCALLNNGSVRCWGKNNYGQLGNGSEETESLTPVSVSGLTGADVGPKITQISSGHYHTCGVTADFKVYCWGSNFYGQFGSGSTGGIRVPRLVSPLAAVNQIFAGNEQTCFQMMDRSIQCSGFNHYGQLGPASLGGYFMAAQAVGGLTNIAVLSTYFNHTCAVTTDGTLKCLGGNSWGQLGDQSRTPSSVPVTAKIETKATKVAVSGVNTCYLDPTGKVYCFGSNGYGGLGTGDRTPVDGPVMVRIRR